SGLAHPPLHVVNGACIHYGSVESGAIRGVTASCILAMREARSRRRTHASDSPRPFWTSRRRVAPEGQTVRRWTPPLSPPRECTMGWNHLSIAWGADFAATRWRRRGRRRTASASRSRPGVEVLEGRIALTTLPPNFIETPVVSGLANPTAMDFAPDG